MDQLAQALSSDVCHSVSSYDVYITYLRDIYSPVSQQLAPTQDSDAALVTWMFYYFIEPLKTKIQSKQNEKMTLYKSTPDYKT